MIKKENFFVLIGAGLASPLAVLAGVVPNKEFIDERLMPDGVVTLVGGVPINTVFFLLTSVSVTAFVIFWLLMLVDCVIRRPPGRLVWLLLLIVSLPAGLYWLTALLYYLLVKMEGDRVAGWRGRAAAKAGKIAAGLKGRLTKR